MILIITFVCLQGVPAAAEIVSLPDKTKDVEVIIKWDKPQNNGAPITQYTVYQRIVSDDGTPRKWQKMEEITDPLVRQLAIKLEQGNIYEFVVTATNNHGESLKEVEKIKQIEILGGK